MNTQTRIEILLKGYRKAESDFRKVQDKRKAEIMDLFEKDGRPITDDVFARLTGCKYYPPLVGSIIRRPISMII